MEVFIKIVMFVVLLPLSIVKLLIKGLLTIIMAIIGGVFMLLGDWDEDEIFENIKEMWISF